VKLQTVCLVLLVSCAGFNAPISTAPKPGYPCGIDGLQCPGGPPLTCCDEGQTCGGPFPAVGCPADMCCDEMLNASGGKSVRITSRQRRP
jgi:hypothetical protein